MQFFITSSLAIFGAVFGSFAGATVWRLRFKQLEFDKQQGEDYDKKEYTRLKKLKNGFSTKDRSRCLSCNHTLTWYDLIPVASWVSAGGKCRYCHKPIGWFEPAIEVLTATLFVISYLAWPFGLSTPLEWTQFAVWLGILTGLMIVFWYDAKWFLVLWVTIWPLLLLGVIFVGLSAASPAIKAVPLIASTAGAIALLAGLYWLLWAISKGRWVGLGDAQIGMVLGLMLMDWQKAFVALILANAIGTLIVIPGLISGKMTRKTAVPFGPLLITGALISFFYGSHIIAWFTNDFSLHIARFFFS